MSLFGIAFRPSVEAGDLIVISVLAPISIAINWLAWRSYLHRRLASLTEADRKLIRNEQAKLSASWSNTIAAGILAVGLIPLAVTAIRAMEGEGTITVPTIVVALALTPMAVILHLIGRLLLGRLRS